jgi:hypothetical protein
MGTLLNIDRATLSKYSCWNIIQKQYARTLVSIESGARERNTASGLLLEKSLNNCERLISTAIGWISFYIFSL